MEDSIPSRRLRTWFDVSHYWKKFKLFRPLLYLFSFHLFLSVIGIALFRWFFAYGKKMAVLHVLLVAGLVATSILLLSLLTSIRGVAQWKYTRITLSVILSLGSMTLILLYVVDFLSNSLWGDHVSYDLVRHNLPHLDIYLNLVNIRPVWVYLALTGSYLMICGFYLVASRPILNGLTCLGLLDRVADHKRFSKAVVIPGLLVLGYIAAVSTMLWAVHGGGAAQREPILSLFVPRTFFTDRPNLAELNLRDQVIRKQLSTARNFERKNVILIIVDAVRADRMQVYGYQRPTTPFLAKLLEEKKLRKVRLAAANCPATYCAVLSVLSSRNVEKLNPGNLKLHELLRDQGYKVYFILSGDHINWLDLKQAYGESVDLYFDGTNSKNFSPTDDRLIFEGLDAVPAYDGRASFFYLHLMSAHNLGIRLDQYAKFQPSQKEMYGKFLATYDPQVLSNTYDNAILQMDDFIRQIFATLEQKGYLKDSIVLILADHGQGLGEHGRYGHARYLFQEQIGIPLLIYDQSNVSYANLDFATQVDVAPTVLDRLGLPVPASWEGKSLLRPSGEQYSYHQTMENSASRAVLFKTHGAIYKLMSAPDKTEELYELVSDPAEVNNLIRIADPSLIQKMKELMKDHTDGQ